MDLLKLSKKFSKLASLKSDMAKRIMYGITQSMTDTIDYPALELAVAGAKDIIKYGTDSCHAEIDEFYKGYVSYGRLQDYNNYKSNKVELNTLPTFIEYLKLFEECFNDSKHWDSDFGGKAWANISKTLKIICENYLKYLQTPKYSKENLQAANDVIIYINVFDGMSHNTYGVFSSLIREEFEDNGVKTNIKELEELMDSKELTDPVDTYNVIKKDLGIDLPYKDYIQKLRQDPGFFKRDPVKVKREISEVSFIRKIKQDFYNNEQLSEILQQVKDLSNKILEDCKKLSENPEFIKTFNKNTLSNIRNMFDGNIRYFYDNIQNIIADSKKNESAIANKIIEQLEYTYSRSEYHNKAWLYIETKLKEIDINNVETILSEIESLVNGIIIAMEDSIDEYRTTRDSI